MLSVNAAFLIDSLYVILAGGQDCLSGYRGAFIKTLINNFTAFEAEAC